MITNGTKNSAATSDVHVLQQRVAELERQLAAYKQVEVEMQTFKSLAENAPDGVGVADLQGRVAYVNPALCTMIGYTEPPVGAMFAEFLS